MGELPRHIVFVLGMHRSGTSALTRALNLLGFAIPKTLIKANATNEGGHWESRALARLNDNYLDAAGLGWSDWRLGDWARVSERTRADYLADLPALIRSEWGEVERVVIKEPRLCRLFAPMREVLRASNSRVDVIIPLRNPLEVIDSLQKRNDLSRIDAALLWLRYCLDAERDTRGVARHFLRYEDLMRAPDAQLKPLAKALNAPVDYMAARTQIHDFLDPDLRHHAHRLEDVVHTPLTENWISETYEALLTLITHPDDAHAMERLDHVREAFDQASPHVSHYLSLSDAHLESVTKTHLEEMSEVENTLARLEADLESLSQERDALQDETQTLSGEKDRLREENANLRSAQRLADKQQQQTAEELKTARSEAEQWQRRVHELQTDLDVARIEAAELEGLAKRAEAAEADLKSVKSKNAKLKADVDELLPRVKASEKKARQLKRQHDRLRDEYRWNKDILQALQGSTSWRVTRPMRAFKRLISGQPLRGTPPVPPQARLTSVPEAAAQPKAIKPLTPPNTSQAKSDIHKIAESGQFDQAWYMAQYPEAEMHPQGAVGHYVLEGVAKQYQPNAQFNSAAYLAAHPELKTSGANPFAHYLRHKSAAPQAMKNVGRIAVFTAISGGYDDLKEPEVGGENVDFFVFTDSVEPEPYSRWQARPFEYHDADPTRTARFIKTHPHLYFADYDWAIWMDGNLTLSQPPETLIPKDGALFATWAHPLRTCVYQEGEECVARDKDDPQVLRDHLARLKAAGFPKEAGLFETSVIVAKMGEPKVVELFKRWWAGIEQGSKRDQLTLPFALREAGVEAGLLAAPGICMRTDPRVIYARHPK